MFRGPTLRCLDATAQVLSNAFADGSSVLVPIGQSSRVVGLVAMSYTQATREEEPRMPVPHGAAYLTNMAVDPKCRRCRTTSFP